MNLSPFYECIDAIPPNNHKFEDDKKWQTQGHGLFEDFSMCSLNPVSHGTRLLHYESSKAASQPRTEPTGCAPIQAKGCQGKLVHSSPL